VKPTTLGRCVVCNALALTTYMGRRLCTLHRAQLLRELTGKRP
jgi:hypothetical protein